MRILALYVLLFWYVEKSTFRSRNTIDFQFIFIIIRTNVSIWYVWEINVSRSRHMVILSGDSILFNWVNVFDRDFLYLFPLPFHYHFAIILRHLLVSFIFFHAKHLVSIDHMPRTSSTRTAVKAALSRILTTGAKLSQSFNMWTRWRSPLTRTAVKATLSRITTNNWR